MKKLLLMSLLGMICLSIKAQTLPIDSTSKKVTYTAVIQAEGLNKERLYSNAKNWFIQYFKSAKDVIQLDDKEDGRIIGKGNTQLNGYRLGYTIDIIVKGDKFKYVISDLTYQNNPNEYVTRTDVNQLEYLLAWDGNKDGNGNYKKPMVKIIKEISDVINTITASLTKGMLSKTNTNDF